jgi:hypothetical protein
MSAYGFVAEESGDSFGAAHEEVTIEVTLMEGCEVQMLVEEVQVQEAVEEVNTKSAHAAVE